MDYDSVPSRNSLSKASVKAAIEERRQDLPKKGIVRGIMEKLAKGEKVNPGIRKKIDDADPGRKQDEDRE